MGKRLTGSCGTGKKIIENWDNFTYEFKSQEDSFYLFEIGFYNQKGTINIQYIDGKIKNVTIDCNFQRPLGSYNDSSLIAVGEELIRSLGQSK